MKKYFVTNTITEDERKFNSLKKAVEYAIKANDSANLISTESFNLDYYKYGDTFEELYTRCKEILK